MPITTSLSLILHGWGPLPGAQGPGSDSGPQFNEGRRRMGQEDGCRDSISSQKDICHRIVIVATDWSTLYFYRLAPIGHTVLSVISY